MEIKKRISKHPVMLHGTSGESVAILFETGVLPSGRPDYVRHPSQLWYSDVQKDRLYFNPVRSELRDTPLYSRLVKGCTRTDAIGDSRSYARGTAIEEYLRKVWGFKGVIRGRKFEWISTLEDRSSVDSLTDNEIGALLKDFKMGMYDLGRARIDLNESVKRKGVIVEVDKGILQFKHGTVLRKGDDAVWVYLPNGLPIEHVVATHPLSRVDDNLLQPYFRK